MLMVPFVPMGHYKKALPVFLGYGDYASFWHKKNSYRRTNRPHLHGDTLNGYPHHRVGLLLKLDNSEKT
jgi:hypothetical protein